MFLSFRTVELPSRQDKVSAMSGPSSSRGIEREREQSSDLYSIDDGPLAPEKR
jgi:hypothetical protein